MIVQNTNTISVLIVDDQLSIQEMLKAYLSEDPSIKVVGIANSGQSAIALIEELNPDIAILDIEMPGLDGLSACGAIVKRFPSTKVLVLSSYDDVEYLNRAIQMGVNGYLHKATPPAELINTIHSIHKGYFQLGPGMHEEILRTNIERTPQTYALSNTGEHVQHLNASASQPTQPHFADPSNTSPYRTALSQGAQTRNQYRELSNEERVRFEQQLSKAVVRIRSLEQLALLTMLVVATLGFICLLLFY